MGDRTQADEQPGAADFELQKIATGNGAAEYLYERVLKTVSKWKHQ